VIGKGIYNCKSSLKCGTGHIVIVKEVQNQPKLAEIVGEGLRSIKLLTMEASGSGAINRDEKNLFQISGSEGSPDSFTGFIRLHLFELHPGLDPDTVQGLSNLNVRGPNRCKLKTEKDTADSKRLTLDKDCKDLNEKICCKDKWPDKEDAAEEPEGSCK
jgi:hypothetical protein